MIAMLDWWNLSFEREIYGIIEMHRHDKSNVAELHFICHNCKRVMPLAQNESRLQNNLRRLISAINISIAISIKYACANL